MGRFSQILEAGLIIWWKRNGERLPRWSKACKDILLLQPSSAAAECHFIELSQIDKSLHSKILYIETSVILQYNSNFVMFS